MCVPFVAYADVTIVEVGAWNINSLSDDPVKCERSIAVCITQLELEEKLGAACCVAWSDPEIL